MKADREGASGQSESRAQRSSSVNSGKHTLSLPHYPGANPQGHSPNRIEAAHLTSQIGTHWKRYRKQERSENIQLG